MRIIALRLSCVATAIALPHIFRYHHTPANRAAHVSSSAGAKDPTIMAVEELLSLGECFKPDEALEKAQEAKAKKVARTSAGRKQIRAILSDPRYVHHKLTGWRAPYVGNSWFERVATGKELCEKGGKIHTFDSCFDLIYYKENVNQFYAATPLFRHNLNKSRSVLAIGERFPKVDVAIHIRLGDVGRRRLPPDYFANISRKLVDREECGACTFSIHHNAELGEEPELRSAFDHAFGEAPEVDVQFHGKETSLVAAFHQMIAADIFIASVSSFSNVVGLLRGENGGRVIFPACENVHIPLRHYEVEPCSLARSAKRSDRGGSAKPKNRWKKSSKGKSKAQIRREGVVQSRQSRLKKRGGGAETNSRRLTHSKAFKSRKKEQARHPEKYASSSSFLWSQENCTNPMGKTLNAFTQKVSGNTSLDNRVAVCISGELRTFLTPAVQTGYLRNFHRANYDYFLSTVREFHSSISRHLFPD